MENSKRKPAPVPNAPRPVGKQKKKKWREILTIPSFSGAGELRQTNNMLVVFVFCLFIGMLWQDCNYRSGYNDISTQQWMVVKESCNGDVALGGAGDFQTAPDELTIKSIAVNVVKLVQEAGTKNIEENYARVNKLLTETASRKFSVTAQKQSADLKDLKETRGLSVYRVIPPNELAVRPITAKDFPPGVKIQLTKFDVAVIGKVVTYDAATNMQITADDFFFHIRVAPLEARTLENIWGLKVESILQLNPKESLGTLEKAKADAEKQKADQDSSGFLPNLSAKPAANANTGASTPK